MYSPNYCIGHSLENEWHLCLTFCNSLQNLIVYPSPLFAFPQIAMSVYPTMEIVYKLVPTLMEAISAHVSLLMHEKVITNLAMVQLT